MNPTPLDFASMLPDQSAWPACRSKGCDLRASPHADDGRCGRCRGADLEARERRREGYERLQDARIPERYTPPARPDLRQCVRNADAIRAAFEWAKAPRPDRLVLIGQTGCGKTSLATATLRHLIVARGLRGVFVDGLELAQQRKAARLGSGEPVLIARASDEPIAVLDDIGQAPSDHTGATEHVIFQRHQHCRPTIFTSFLDVRGVADKFGGGVARRMFEGATVLRLDGQGAKR